MGKPKNIRGPLLRSCTTLEELGLLGVRTLGDIPMDELLEYVRHELLEVVADLDEDEPFDTNEFARAVSSVDEAISHFDLAFHYEISGES